MTLCCISHILVKSLNSCDVNCVPSSETIRSRHTYFHEDLLDMFDYTHGVETLQFPDNGKLTEIITELEDNVCSLMRKCLDHIVPKHFGVFQQNAASPFAEFLQTLYRCHIYDM